jgi:hemerythrin
MPCARWRQEFSVRNELLDTQHKTLLEMLNTLYDAHQAGRSGEHAESILERMMRYAEKHFYSEETLLRKHGFPDQEEHRALHQHFIRNVMDFRQQNVRGETGIGDAILHFLVEWLVNHILEEDRKYIPYIADDMDLENA